MAKINTNSNAYTITYACVVVVVVAFLLAFVYTALKPQSDANVALDKQNQILKSLNITCEKSEVDSIYRSVVVATQVINKDLNVVEGREAFDVETKEISDACLPVYECSVNGETKYVLPLVGRGLWGGLWGYISLDADKSTVYGIYFGHESETAGLGALIAEERFQSQFRGKKIFDANGEIALHVFKAGKAGNTARENYCDAVTGATLTSNGVNDMLMDCLQRYVNFLKQ